MSGLNLSNLRGRLPFKLAALLIFALLTLLIAASFISYRNTITPHGIVIHHSAVTTTYDGRPVDMSVLDGYHRRRGFGIFYWGRIYHIGYHYIIYPDGQVEQGRPDNCQGAHAVGHNTNLGICLIGDFTTSDASAREGHARTPTDAQMRALVELSKRLRKQHDIPLESIRLHRDLNADTQCPGDNFPLAEFMHRLADQPAQTD